MRTVGDQRPVIPGALKQAQEDTQAVHYHRRPGPHADDLTKPCLRNSSSDKIIFRDDLLGCMSRLVLPRAAWRMPETSHNQAEFRRTTDSDSQSQTARQPTGIHYDRDGIECSRLPGIPSEMRAMNAGTMSSHAFLEMVW